MGKLILNGKEIVFEKCSIIYDKEMRIIVDSTNISYSEPESLLQKLSFQNQDLFLMSLLNYFQAPANLNGYQYLRRALELGIEQPNIFTSITKTLYPTLAKEFGGVSTGKIERSIHTVIVAILENEDQTPLKTFFGSAYGSLKGKRNNAYVLSLISTQITLLLSEHPLQN